ncbi:MAG TPA: GNAT family protein [Chitinispirillaceae bacterium]|nr:GNAT family protein [Chitinispirillaceae bacterium]
MIRLEKFDTSDFDRLISWIDSEESMIQFSGPVFKYPVTHGQLDKYVNADNRLVFKVINSDSGEIIGHAELNNIDNKNKSARICRILIGEKHNRNKGFGKEIIKALIKIGFYDLHLHRLDLGVFDFNHQAIKCYKDCGFEIEGLLKDTTKIGSEYWSIYNMSIINRKNDECEIK